MGPLELTELPRLDWLCSIYKRKMVESVPVTGLFPREEFSAGHDLLYGGGRLVRMGPKDLTDKPRVAKCPAILVAILYR